MQRQNPRIIRTEEDEESQPQEPENIFNKNTEKIVPNLKKEMPMNIQETYKIRLDQKRKPSCNKIIKTKH